jgi:hypothetical protein
VVEQLLHGCRRLRGHADLRLHRLHASAARIGSEPLGWLRELSSTLGAYRVRSQIGTVLYLVLMAAVITAVDLLFFKNRFWQRLTVNLGIVLVFAAFYFRFLKRP